MEQFKRINRLGLPLAGTVVSNVSLPATSSVGILRSVDHVGTLQSKAVYVG
jgi:hypothetical protein